MKAQGGGHIIGIASGSSFRGFYDEVIYCAGKHGVEGFVKALAFEAAPYNIALNTIGPGKRIKPTGVGQSEVDRMSEEEKAGWADPIELGKAFVWLANQPPCRYSGLRFDAGPLADAIAAEGWDFAFTPEKVTPQADDVRERLDWQANYGKE
jgi:NAD(P)-dependent dehydrogenase (short-subunit alcohol dehydrogenase family)